MDKIAFLITRPEHDEATYYLSNWSESSIKLAELKGINVIDLHLNKANSKEVESRLIKLSPGFVVFNGHGDENTIFGHKDEPLITLGKNEKLLASKIVYSISCSSAKNLGPESVKAGAINYTGYDKDFFLVFEPEKFSRPLEDKTAKLFLSPSVLFVDSIIKGNKIKEAFDKSKNLMKDNFRLSLSVDTDSSRFLWWNIQNFKSHGDVEPSISHI